MFPLAKTLFYKCLLLAAFSPGGESYRPSDEMLLDPSFLKALKEVSLDKGLSGYFYFNEESVSQNRNEFERLQQREIDLRDCPPLLDRERIPGLDYCSELRAFLSDLKDHHYKAIGVTRNSDDLINLCAAIQASYDFYSLFQQVHWSQPYEARVLLREIRDKMGWDAYYKGEWPNPFPRGALSFSDD